MEQDLLAVIQAELSGVLSKMDSSVVERAAIALDAAPRVFVVGAGRSGFMADAFAMRLVHLGLTVHVVGEATAPTLRTGDTLVAVSGSGTTAGTVRAAEEARRSAADVIAVTTDPDSALGGLAGLVLHVPAATKNRRAGEAATVQPLSSLFDQSVHLILDAVCLRLAELRRLDNDAAKNAHVRTE
jgi:6-phospho-3-hexuloisomerase